MSGKSLTDAHHLLTINSGSSSIKFALFEHAAVLRKLATGQIDRIGLPDARFRARSSDGVVAADHTVEAVNHVQAVELVVNWLDRQGGLTSLGAVGHRVVHGGERFLESVAIDDDVLHELERLIPLAPNHLPGEVAAIAALRARCPGLPQFGCFDTAFHRTLPSEARQLPIPRRYAAAGVRRYGFHGLSYQFLMQELHRVAGERTAQGRVILAHLGAGCSLAAVREGSCIDTTMGFTPAAGLVMATRTGDLDPGFIVHLLRTERLSADELDNLINKQSGLLGVSETSSDIRDLLAREESDPRAAEAIALFCYQLRKHLGAFTAALGGLDTLVFSAGIGENSPAIRARVCSGLRFLGIELDQALNDQDAPIISSPGSPVTVRVIRTDEESLIAAEVLRLL
ncbi:MAG: acetate/propionate family kinase [Planctomycetaceae bacterium]|nr:acetate/propionate family kinase [Planctomycetaceae bacterium]